MNKDQQQRNNNHEFILNNQSFLNWSSLNDSIMGGSSQAECRIKPNGLLLDGNLVEEDGGFVSCRSSLFNPPLNLSEYSGLQVEVDGEGRTLKFAIYCKAWMLSFSDIFASGLHWAAEIRTLSYGTTTLNIPFSDFQPSIQAKQFSIPFGIDKASITQFQILHSKFGLSGSLNQEFRPGKINILLRSISGFH